MSDRAGNGLAGFGRLLTYSLAAAVVALVVTKLRGRSAKSGSESSGHAASTPEETQGRTPDAAGRQANPDPISAAEEQLIQPEVDPSIAQAAVQTTEIDPFAWPDPPAPPPVVPADTSLSTLVHDGSSLTNPEPGSAVDPTAPSIAAIAAVTAPISSAQIPPTPTPDPAPTGPQRTGANTQSDTDALDQRGGLLGGDGNAHQHANVAMASGPMTSEPPASGDANTGGRTFYGWYLVAAVFVILCITSGVGFYNASVILAAATRELDASVGSVSGATGLFFAFGGLTGFVFSKRMESVDIRLFFVAGGIVGAAALMGLRWVTNVPGLYVFFGFFGIAFGLAGLVPATTLVTRWFDRRRSVALSIASTGLSLGGIIVTPFSDWLIDQRSLSGAAPYLAVIWIVGVIPIALLFVRSYPADKGLRPDGDPAPLLDTAPQAETPGAVTEGSGRLGVKTGDAVAGLSFARARTTRFFIALCLAYAVIFFGQVGGIAQLFNMILERTDAPTARTALATLAGSSVVFRLLGGAAVLRVPTKAFSAALAVVQAAALILLAVTNSSTGLILSAAFFGCSIGNLLMLQPLLLAEAFGVANYGRIYSFNQLFGTIGVAGGPFALGLIRDAADYRLAFLAAAAASFIGCLAIIAAGSTARVTALWQ